jgi:hypothetical protein
MTHPQDGETSLVQSAAPQGAERAPAAPSGPVVPGATSKDRMRLTRQRRRQGLRCVVIEIREREIDALIRRKRLAPDDHANLAAIRKALYGFLDDNLG